MASDTYVRISLERQKIILGQIGNMRAKTDQLKVMLQAVELEGIVPFVEEIETELAFFEKYFPSIPDKFPF